MHYNRGQSIKYLKKAFNIIRPDDEIELDSDTLLFASEANSSVYIGDSLDRIANSLEKLIDLQDGDKINGSRDEVRGRAA